MEVMIKMNKVKTGILFICAAATLSAFVCAPVLILQIKHQSDFNAEVFKIENELQMLRHAVQAKVAQELIYLKVLVLNHKVKPSLAKEIAEAVYLYSRQFNKDPDLILAIIKQESDFNPTARSKANAYGLMQIFPSWKKTACAELDLSIPTDNINCGIRVYSFYEEAYKDIKLTLTVYNRGPNPVDHDLAKDRDPINAYADKVMETYEKLKVIGSEETP
jgi:soluble lytic murein transglycosylase-like protein